MNMKIITLVMMSFCLTGGLRYLSGNVNWQPSLEKNKNGWITIIVNVYWQINSGDKALCDQTAKEPRMDITGYIDVFNKKYLKGFTKLRCKIVELDGGQYIILSVNYQKSYEIKPSHANLVRISGKVDTANPTSKSWHHQLTKSSTSTPPIAGVPPLVMLCFDYKKALIHYIQALNVDTSYKQRCRWSTGNECGDICSSAKQKQQFKLAEDCTMTYQTNSFQEMIDQTLKPQILTITVESYRNSGMSTVASSTNLHFSVIEFPMQCPDSKFSFPNSIKQKEFFQQRCSKSEDLEIQFDVKSSGNGGLMTSQSVRDIQIAEGPLSSELRITASSSTEATYLFSWKPTEEEDGTYPICFSVTTRGQTKYECSTLTSYSNTAIQKKPCKGRKNCEANKFCKATKELPMQSSTTTTTELITSTTHPMTIKQHDTTTTEKASTTMQQPTTTSPQPTTTPPQPSATTSQPTTTRQQTSTNPELVTTKPGPTTNMPQLTTTPLKPSTLTPKINASGEETSTMKLKHVTEHIYLKPNQTISDTIQIKSGVSLQLAKGVHRLNIEPTGGKLYIVHDWTPMEKTVKLQAEYNIVKCSSITELSYTIITATLNQHTKNLQLFCADCQILDVKPNVECLKYHLYITWSTNITDIKQGEQVRGNKLASQLENGLNRFHPTRYPVMTLTLLQNGIPKILLPVKDKSGSYLHAVIESSCLEKGYTYNNLYDSCEQTCH